MSQLFLVDESLSPKLAVKLGELGYSAKSVREIGLKGFDDIEMVEWAIKNNAVIITGDLDFGELWYWHYRTKVSVIVLRVKPYNFKMHFLVIKYLHENNILKSEKIKNSLIISTQYKYRIRRE